MLLKNVGLFEKHEVAIKSRDGLALWTSHYRPKGVVKGTVVIAHGLAEHHERYSHAISFFLDHGFAVQAYDMRGHGRSEGARCFVDHFSTYADDLEVILEMVKGKDLPIYFLSHSMGTLVTMLFLNRHLEKFPIQAVVFIGMPIKPTVEVSPVKKFFSHVFDAFYPHLALSAGIDSRFLSRDESVGRMYDADPLVCKKVTVGWYQAFQETIAALPQDIRDIKVPALFLHGADDRIAHPDGSRVMFQVYPCDEKQLHIYEGCYHELLNEVGHEAIFGEILNWYEKYASLKNTTKSQANS